MQRRPVGFGARRSGSLNQQIYHSDPPAIDRVSWSAGAEDPGPGHPDPATSEVQDHWCLRVFDCLLTDMVYIYIYVIYDYSYIIYIYVITIRYVHSGLEYFMFIVH